MEALLHQAARAQPPSYRARLRPRRLLRCIVQDLRRSSRWDRARIGFAASSQQVRDDLAPYYRAAEQLLGRGRDPSRSERYFRAYLAQEPEGNEPPAAEAHWKLGLALEAQGHLVEAIAEWEEALRLDRESPAARELKRLRGSRAADGPLVSPGLRGAQTQARCV